MGGYYPAEFLHVQLFRPRSARRREPLTTLFDKIRSSEMGPLVTDALRRFERIRHRGRLRLVAIAMHQGMSVEEIQDRWAVTRWLAIRNLGQAEGMV